MSWTELTTEDKNPLDLFARIVKSGADHYETKYSAELAGSYLKEKNGKKGHLFLYEDDTFRIALAFKWSSQKMWKVANCLVEQVKPGVGDAFEAVKIVVRRFRAFMDETGVNKAYSLTPNKTFNDFQDEFHVLYATVMWEHTKVLDTTHLSDEFPDGIWINTFNRDASRVNEDELWDNNEAS